MKRSVEKLTNDPQTHSYLMATSSFDKNYSGHGHFGLLKHPDESNIFLEEKN